MENNGLWFIALRLLGEMGIIQVGRWREQTPPISLPEGEARRRGGGTMNATATPPPKQAEHEGYAALGGVSGRSVTHGALMAIDVILTRYCHYHFHIYQNIPERKIVLCQGDLQPCFNPNALYRPYLFQLSYFFHFAHSSSA